MRSLRASVIRLAYKNPSLRPHILPLVKEADAAEAMDLVAGRTWGNPDPRSTPDDNSPYNSHPDSPSAGADGSAQRKKYNEWFHENVCPTHATKCGDPDRFGE
jgi:hypothetical protein